MYIWWPSECIFPVEGCFSYKTKAMWANILTILTLFILEAMLSIDNAAVLAVMVKDLPGDQGKRALRYGLVGAYVMRGLCLFIAGWLVNLWGLKIAGGAYLLYLTYGFFSKAADTPEEIVKEKSSVYKWLKKHTGLSDMWMTIVLVELMDLNFSLDNIFAAVAMSPHMWVVIAGVFMGILAMRFVAGGFMVLMQRYPFLDKSAFVVIGLLGVKLIVSGTAQGCKIQAINELMEKHSTDFAFSIALMFVFFIPLLFSYGKRTSGTSQD